MKPMSRWLTLILVVACMRVSVCAAQDGLGLEETDLSFESRDDLFDELKLTEQQREALKEFKNERSEIRKQFFALRAERMDLGDALRDRDASEQEILAQVTKMNQLLGEVNTRKVKNFLALRRALTREQLRKLIQSAREKFAERRNQQGGSFLQQRRAGAGAGPMPGKFGGHWRGGDQPATGAKGGRPPE